MQEAGGVEYSLLTKPGDREPARQNGLFKVL
jgi:hypothetical protein